jgi:hypothetical protein
LVLTKGKTEITLVLVAYEFQFIIYFVYVLVLIESMHRAWYFVTTTGYGKKIRKTLIGISAIIL